MANCAYCGEPIDGVSALWGDKPLHEECMEEIQEEFKADTDTPRTSEELAKMWALHTRSTEKESVDAGFDPDDYGVF